MSFYIMNSIHYGSTRRFIQGQCPLMCVVRNHSYAEEPKIQTDKWNGKYSVITLTILIENQNISIKGDILGFLMLITNSL